MIERNKKDEGIRNYIAKVAASASIVTALAISGLHLIMPPTHPSGRIKRFDNIEPKLIRMYRICASDGIFVEDQDRLGEYITLSKHLKSISDLYQRRLEKKRIEEFVEW